MMLTDRTQWNKIEITRLGVAPDLYNPKPKYGNSELTRIVCVARLIQAKGQDILIDTLKILIDKNYKLHLTLVGNGPERKKPKEKDFFTEIK